MESQKKKRAGLAVAGTAIAAFVARLRRRGDHSEKPAMPSDVRT